MNLGFTAGSDPDVVRQNRRLFVGRVTGESETHLVTVSQVHSNRSVRWYGTETGKASEEADGIITRECGILAGILTADCVPVLVADRRRRIVGAFHAGWRGTVERIVELGVKAMLEGSAAEASGSPGDMVAAIGPAIGRCCYRVGEEVHARFLDSFSYGEQLFSNDGGNGGGPSGLQLDLIEANRRQLLDAGVGPNAISVVGGCTQCRQDLFFSHRGSSGNAGRMMAAIGIRCEHSYG